MKKTIFASLAIMLLLLPVLDHDPYHVRFVSTVFMWVALSEAWNVFSGYTGYIDFGPVAYFGAGAYTTAILMTKAGLPFLISLMASGVIPAAMSIPVGLATLRIRGAYFAIATLAFSEAMKQMVLEFDRITHSSIFGGSFGITLPMGPSHTFFYYTFMGIMALSLGISGILQNSKVGYGLKAIREFETGAELCGVNTLLLKTYAYALSAFITGITGGASAYWLTYISPGDAFNVHTTIQMVVGTLLGGMGTALGPAVGAAFLAVASELLWARFTYEYLALLGIVILIVNTAMPEGIVGRVLRWKRYSA